MTETTDLNRAVGFLLGDLARLLRRDFDRRVQQLGLTQAQWRALMYLARNEGATQASLAEILEIQPISLARLLDRMEGWVERRPSPTDRRAFQLYLTAAAAPLMQQIHDIGAITRDVALAGLNADQRELLTEMLLTVKENLQRGEVPAAAAAVSETIDSAVV